MTTPTANPTDAVFQAVKVHNGYSVLEVAEFPSIGHHAPAGPICSTLAEALAGATSEASLVLIKAPRPSAYIHGAMTLEVAAYDARVGALEAEGLTRSDAQGVVDAEEIKAARITKGVAVLLNGREGKVTKLLKKWIGMHDTDGALRQPVGTILYQVTFSGDSCSLYSFAADLKLIADLDAQAAIEDSRLGHALKGIS